MNSAFQPDADTPLVPGMAEEAQNLCHAFLKITFTDKLFKTFAALKNLLIQYQPSDSGQLVHEPPLCIDCAHVVFLLPLQSPVRDDWVVSV
jgi:hypothetical protein